MSEENVVKKEVLFLVKGMLILSAIMESVFMITDNWSIYVLIANVIGAGVALGNFYFMALTIKRVISEDEESAKKKMKFSQQTRNIIVFVIIIAAASLTAFDIIPKVHSSAYIISLILPLLFNRILITFRARFMIK